MYGLSSRILWTFLIKLFQISWQESGKNNLLEEEKSGLPTLPKCKTSPMYDHAELDGHIAQLLVELAECWEPCPGDTDRRGWVLELLRETELHVVASPNSPLSTRLPHSGLWAERELKRRSPVGTEAVDCQVEKTATRREWQAASRCCHCPQLTASKRRGAWFYRHEELNSANNQWAWPKAVSEAFAALTNPSVSAWWTENASTPCADSGLQNCEISCLSCPV